MPALGKQQCGIHALLIFLCSSVAWAQLNTTSGITTSIPGAPPTPTSSSTTSTSTTVISPTNFLRTNLTLIDALAVCNDGTPGYYYYRPGTGNTTNKWVIRLEGGGFCSDQQSCVARASSTPNLMGSSSMYYPDVLPGASVAGILAGDPRVNPFYAWNHVSIGYCSSDAYLGNAGPSNSPENGVFQFRGQRIVNATILSLLASKNLGTATDVLVAGVSAGGAGVLNLADGIYSTIQPKAPALTNFKGFVDGGWFLDIPSYSMAPSAFTFRKTATNFLSNFQANYNPSCAAKYPNSTWACFFAQYAWPYVKTPLIFHEYLYDGANVGYLATGSQSQVSDVRARLTIGFTTPAGAAQGPANVTIPPPSTSPVRTQSITQPPPPGLQSLPKQAAAPAGLYAPGNLNVPPTGLPPSLLTGPPAPQLPASQLAANESSPPLPSSVTQNSSALPAVFAPACGNHNIADNDLFAVSHIGNVRFTDTLYSWQANGQVTLPLIDPSPTLNTAMACLRAI